MNAHVTHTKTCIHEAQLHCCYIMLTECEAARLFLLHNHSLFLSLSSLSPFTQPLKSWVILTEIHSFVMRSSISITHLLSSMGNLVIDPSVLILRSNHFQNMNVLIQIFYQHWLHGREKGYTTAENKHIKFFRGFKLNTVLQFILCLM